jgi:Bacterial regulatory proteins, gntR family
MSSNTIARTKAQEASSSSAKKFAANVITDLRSRDNWMKIFNAVAVHDRSVNKSALALGNRLALYHNVKGGRCDPGIPELAAALGVSESTIDRGIKALTSTGWITRKRGGRYDTADVLFNMPPEQPSQHDQDADVISVNMVTLHMNRGTEKKE